MAFNELRDALEKAVYGDHVPPRYRALEFNMGGITIECEAPHPGVEDKIPIVVYFDTRAEADQFVGMVRQALPNLMEHKL